VDLEPENPMESSDSAGATVRMVVPQEVRTAPTRRPTAPSDGNGRLIAVGVAVVLILLLLGALAATAILLLLWLLLA
jgi:hypothetical protein